MMAGVISRRTLLRAAATSALVGLGARGTARALGSPEVLYNGIRLGSPWPPRLKYPNEQPIVPPYLGSPPDVIPIDVGRQLFVDDFLVADTTLTRRFHRPVYHPRCPVLRPEAPWEHRDDMAERTRQPPNPAAMVFSDGVFYDPRDRVFKMWYMGGYGMTTCLALSDDGIEWRRPSLGVVPGTNIVNRDGRDSTTVWLDAEAADPRKRYRMSAWFDHTLRFYTSPDGVRWSKAGESQPVLDRSTFFYNPFRKVWVFSLRATQYEGSVSGRYRQYWETRDFDAARDWRASPPVAWVKADTGDFARPELAARPELYNLDAVAYESLIVGLFSVWRGESSTREKVNEIAVGFSRDGFHWWRPDREAFLPVSDAEGAWNWANVQSAGGCCLVVGDELYFYVSGRQGRPGTDAPGVCSTGLATMRRDGFASMDWRMDGERVRRVAVSEQAAGTLTTRPVRFAGRHLFVNADLGGGELRAEVLDRDGRVLPPFASAACVPVAGDATRLAVRWAGADLGAVTGEAVRFRFSMTRGRLYAFWVSAWPSGESGGYPAAGGPGFRGMVDSRA